MRVEWLKIDGFGCLAGKRHEFPPGKVTLILDENEAGKSTLAAAILAALCGLPTRKRAGEVAKLIDVYRPWSGGTYAVEAGLETAIGRVYVRRDFNKGNFFVRDISTNRDITRDFDVDLASTILGISRDDLLRVAFISGKDVQAFKSSDTIRARLSAVVEGSNTQTGAEPAIAALGAARYSVNGSSLLVERAVKRLISDLEDRRERMRQLDEKLDLAEADVRALDEALEAEERLRAEMSRLDNEYKVARLAEVRARLADADRAVADVADYERELAELLPLAGFPFDRTPQLEGAVVRLRRAEQGLAELESESASLREKVDVLAKQLEQDGQLNSATEDDVSSIRGFAESLDVAVRSVRVAEEAVERERRLMVAAGTSSDREGDALKRFDSLPKEDQDFLDSYREFEVSNRSVEATSVLNEEAAASKIAAIRYRRRSTLVSGLIVALMGVGLLIAGIIDRDVAALVVAGVGLAGGAGLIIAGGLIGADTLARLNVEKDAARSRVAEARADLDAAQSRLAEIAERVGADVGAVVEMYREWKRGLTECLKLQELCARAKQAAANADEQASRASRLLSRLGIDFDALAPLESVARAEKLVSAHLERRRQHREAKYRLSDVERKISTEREGAKSERRIIAEIVDEAGISSDLPPIEALQSYRDAEKKARRLVQIRDELLPEAKKRLLSEDMVQRLREEESQLSEASAHSEEAAKPLADVEAARKSVAADLERASRLVRELEGKIGVVVRAYRAEYELLREQTRELESELARAKRFEKATGIAHRVLSEVAESSHRAWAEALNREAAALLPRLNPDYYSLLFNDRLEFTLRRASDGKVLEKGDIDSALSTGAKDQVYLAVRLACCVELSGAGETIPIILDDPFLSFDDERFASGLECLTELATDRQVIVLSCHRNRHQTLADRPWFRDRVHMLSV